MQAPTIALGAAEKLIEQAVQLDPLAAPCFAALADKVIAIDLQGLDMRVYILPHPQGVSLLSEYEGDVDVTIRAAPFTLLRMMNAQDSTLLSSGEVILEGEHALAQRLTDCFRAIEIDWEEHLSRIIGDIPAHWLGHNFRQATRWGQQQGHLLQQNFSEYLQEEARVIPAPAEVQAFMEDVDTLTADVDRLAQRIARLERG
jgi:ubiquinone biosynthesis protein UbiJ